MSARHVRLTCWPSWAHLGSLGPKVAAKLARLTYQSGIGPFGGSPPLVMSRGASSVAYIGAKPSWARYWECHASWAHFWHQVTKAMSVLNTLDLSQKLVSKLLNSLHQQPDITNSTSFQSKPQQQTQHNTTQNHTAKIRQNGHHLPRNGKSHPQPNQLNPPLTTNSQPTAPPLVG